MDTNLLKCKPDCRTCADAKATRSPISKVADSQYKAIDMPDVMHGDLVGPVTIRASIEKDGKKIKCKINCPTFDGFLHALIMTEEFTHCVFVVLLKTKDEATDAVMKIIRNVQNKTGRKVLRFQTDGAGELSKAQRLIQYFDVNGTDVTTSNSYTPRHNGLAERMNRTMFEMVRAFLAHASAPPQFWGEALKWACHVYNSTPHRVTNFIAPYEALRKYRYNLQDLRVWGCDVQVMYTPNKQTKVDSKTWKGIFVGFDKKTSSYLILNPLTMKLSASSDVIHHEESFELNKQINNDGTLPEADSLDFNNASPYAENVGSASAGLEVVNDDDTVDDSAEAEIKSGGTDSVDDSAEAELKSGDTDSKIEPILDPEDGPMADESQVEPVAADHVENASSDSESEESVSTDINKTDPVNQNGRVSGDEDDEIDTVDSSTEISRESQALQDAFKSWNDKHIRPLNVRFNTRSARGRVITLPNRPLTNDPRAYDPRDMSRALEERANCLTENHEISDLGDDEDATMFIHVDHDRDYVFIANVSAPSEPRSFKEAMRSPDAAAWWDAILAEFNSLTKMGVWKLVKRPKGIKVLKGRWVLKNKLGEHNEIVRRKARFVAKGYLQSFGIDYFETFAPVAKMKSIKLILSIVAKDDLELHQMDYETAFLNARLEEKIYMEQPEGFVEDSDQVLLLIKAIYGLKQAPNRWNKTVDDYLQSLGYKPLRSDPCVYIKRSRTNRLIILCLYVDDTLIAFHKQDQEEWFSDKKEISRQFPIQDLGECNWILNMKVIRDREKRTITLSQQAFIERIAEQYAPDKTGRTVDTPLNDQHELWKTIDNSQHEVKPLDSRDTRLYCSIVGALLYASNISRIDITYAVGQLCRYTSKPCIHHLEAAYRVIRYVRNTPQLCLIFGLHSQNMKQTNLIAYCDSDWAGDKGDGKSTSGCVIRFNGDVMNWLSKKQKSVAQSSAEAEYIAAAETTKELLWYRSWISEVLFEFPVGVIHCDNQAAIILTKNDTIHERSKHIRLRYHFIRDEIKKNHVQIKWVKSADQQADILTKPLQSTSFARLRDKLIFNP